MAIGDLARKAPPPEALEKGEGAAYESPDEDDQAAGVGMMEEFLSAIGVKGADAASAYEAFCRLIDSHR